MKNTIMKVAAEKIQCHGLRKFTMNEIASELKISKKTIYKYFKSKNDIIFEYFKEIIESDKKYTMEGIEKESSLEDKLSSIIFSYHKYKLPVSILDEAYKFYYEKWKEIESLKNFKLKLIENILKEAMESGELKEGIDIHIISFILESVSSTLLDYKFLSKNNITMKDAMDDTLKILLYGILKN
ncbi:TetR/AcrR family transcriptional regulator [Haloimpatiens massiliensis]|uniref:TetR/AcrR family transcriptional regulator n=1 Tax=Haloimpatiens massiliensis TaxID=1658110 RepID=UPI000C85DA73|nr:TetR/AcrR family transcriptional regulator [Haloimpatiens massiliensis]